MTAVLATPALVAPRSGPRHAPTPRWWKDAVGVACWGTALVVTYLWLSGGALHDLQGARSAQLSTLSRLAGLVAADLLLVQVFLMARVPVIERSYGQDELARRHRLVGFWSFNLVLLHVVLITAGYEAGQRGFLPELWRILTTYGGMVMASIATASVVLVAVTSVRMARRALRYETWHLVHLYAYLGVGLAIPHQLWTGADLISSPLARVYWVGTYVLAAGAVVVFRVGLPLWRTLRHGLVVSDVTQEAPGVVSIRVKGRDLQRLPARAGQFFVWRFLDGAGWSRGNPYSLSAAPDGAELRLTVKELGDGSGRLGSVRPGTRVLVEGPYGRLTGEHRMTDRVVLMACGIGITPLRALLEALPYEPGKAALVYRARSEAELVHREEIEELAERRGVRVHYVLGPRIRGRRSWLPTGASTWSDKAVLLHLVPDLTRSDVFVCGPDEWMQAVVTAVRRAGLPPAQLHLERFSW